MKMLNMKNTKRLLWLSVLVTGVLFITFQQKESSLAQSNSIVLKVQNQPNSPIQISSAVITSRDTISPRYDYVVTNVSNKPISSFAIKADVIFGKNTLSPGISFANFPEIELLLLPNTSRLETFEGNVKYSAPVKEITFIVDFVEFVDGTTWGPDNYKYTDYLSGLKEGGRVTKDYFKDKLGKGEINLVFEGIKNRQAIPIGVAKNDSRFPKRWKEGFEAGVRLVRSRLRDAGNRSNIDGIKAELERPFDASGGRKKL